MRHVRSCLVVLAAFASVKAFAQESEFKAKMQEELDGYKDQLKANCGFEGGIEWTGGKFGHNPNEGEKPEYNALTTLCTSALSGLATACQNGEVKKAVGKVRKVECKKGKGTMSYKLGGGSIAFMVDESFTKNNASGQQTDLTEKMKKDLDK